MGRQIRGRRVLNTLKHLGKSNPNLLHTVLSWVTMQEKKSWSNHWQFSEIIGSAQAIFKKASDVSSSPGRVLWIRQRWCFVTIQNLSVPIFWILGKVLESTSPKRANELDVIQRRGVHAAGDREAALRRKNSEVRVAWVWRGEGWSVYAIKVYKNRRPLNKLNVELLTKLCNIRNRWYSKLVNKHGYNGD